MKRTCDGCSAFLHDDFSARCELRYPIETVRHYVVMGRDMFSYAPTQECPKPRSNKQFLEILKEKLGRGEGAE